MRRKTPVDAKLNVGLYLNSRSANVLKLVRALRDWGLSFRSVMARGVGFAPAAT